MTQLFIEGQNVDLYQDLSILLTFTIADVTDSGSDPDKPSFSNRQTTYSKTVILPGTGNNNQIFGNIFEPGHSSDGGTEENTDSVIRILQTKKVSGVSDWAIIADSGSYTGLTSYGYAGHLDDPDNPSNDLNFGVLNELYFTLVTGDLSRTQFNLYYSSYFAEITDKDNKMFVGNFYLTPQDIYNLDFSKYITLDGVLWRLNAIRDYSANTLGTSTVELLKVQNTIY